MTRNERTARIVAETTAARILTSTGVSPATLHSQHGDLWYLQWADLRALAEAAQADKESQS